jgi:hypothetical protein
LYLRPMGGAYARILTYVVQYINYYRVPLEPEESSQSSY